MKGFLTGVTPIMAGTRTDIERLLEKFVSVPTVRYQHFEKCFCEMHFYAIFSGRSSENELREFSEKLLMTTLSYCFPPYSFQTQVGAVYLLYALYYVQPKQYRMKIRTTIQLYSGLHQLFMTLHEQQHFDVCYVLQRLFSEHAFLVCAYLDEHNPLTYHRNEGRVDVDKVAETLRASKNSMDELIEDPSVQQVATVHQQYMLLKDRLFDKAERLPPSLSIVTSCVTDYLRCAVQDCEDRLEKRFGNKRSFVEPETVPKDQSIKDVRAAIRERAYGKTSTTNRFERRQRYSSSNEPDTNASSINTSDASPSKTTARSSVEKKNQPKQPRMPKSSGKASTASAQKPSPTKSSKKQRADAAPEGVIKEKARPGRKRTLLVP